MSYELRLPNRIHIHFFFNQSASDLINHKETKPVSNEFALDATFYTFQSEVVDNLRMGRVAEPIQHIRDFGQEKRTKE
jgi:hypothetical protein